MNKPEKKPIWVALAFSSIESLTTALYLIYGCAIFTLYCFPWLRYFSETTWVIKVFLVNDWSWFVVSLACTIWYWLSLKWIDSNCGWATAD